MPTSTISAAAPSPTNTPAHTTSTASTSASTDPLSTVASDLGQDTSGLLPDDWDLEPWNPSLYTRAYYGRNMEKYTILPFSPAYFAHSHAPLEVLPWSPGMSGSPARPIKHCHRSYAATSTDPTSGFSICNYISPTSQPINCFNIMLLLLLGIGLVGVGVLTK